MQIMAAKRLVVYVVSWQRYGVLPVADETWQILVGSKEAESGNLKEDVAHAAEEERRDEGLVDNLV